MRRADNVEGEFLTVPLGINDAGGARQGRMKIPPHTADGDAQQNHHRQQTPEEPSNEARYVHTASLGNGG